MIFNELDTIINLAFNSIERFKAFIDIQRAQHQVALYQPFWEQNGAQTTILNYLIRQHNDSERNLSEHIAYLVDNRAAAIVSIYTYKSFHLAFRNRQASLLYQLLELIPLLPVDDLQIPQLDKQLKHQIGLNACDSDGRTLISRAIELNDARLLDGLLKRGIDFNQPTTMVINQVTFHDVQPLHQAVLSNSHVAIDMLIKAGASIANPHGVNQEPPLLLAARYGQLNALQALLSHTPANALDSQNTQLLTAVDLLCQRLQEKNDSDGAIRGIAMLLCHGALAPGLDFRTLLRDNRVALLDAVLAYSAEQPHLSANFIRAVHNKNNPLHEILYAGKTWGYSFRHLFGVADDLVFKCETLVSRHQEQQSANNVELKAMPLVASEHVGHVKNEALFDNKELLFAKFVELYERSVKSRLFFNPWSDMRWKLGTEITSWDAVLAYAHARGNHNTRTAMIVRDILQPNYQLHNDLSNLEQKEEEDESFTPR